MSRFLKVKKNKKEKGITLIALITTIIVLLILAGISIGAITGSNGIIGGAQSAKEETEISQEKEIIDISTVEAMGKNNRGNLAEEEFQNAIDKHTNGKASVSDIGEEFEVFFEESNRYYTVDKEGNVIDYVDIVTDNSPGDITKDKNGKELAGTEDEPYEIWCIEDLIEWSNNYTTYRESSIILCRNLNFKSRFSYADSSRTDYGDINEDNITESLMEEMQKGNGFKPISSFTGIFDGKNHSIDNIYINSTQDAGLFGRASNVVISNLKISGSVFGKSSAGIIGQGSGNITCINLRNECNVQGTGSGNTGGGVGGIVGYIVNSENGPKIKFVNCENKGSIVGEQSAGGIIGYVYATSNRLQNVYIYNSYNHGNVQSGTGNAGGIIGWLNADGAEGKSNGEIYNCYNTGKISSTTQESQSSGCTGGIYGLFRSMTSATLEIKNSYILEELNIRVGKSGWQCLVNGEKLTIDNKNAEFLENNYMQSQEFVNKLNSFELEGENLSKWILGESGYPELEVTMTENTK